jgi:hypothetical protein
MSEKEQIVALAWGDTDFSYDKPRNRLSLLEDRGHNEIARSMFKELAPDNKHGMKFGSRIICSGPMRLTENGHVKWYYECKCIFCGKRDILRSFSLIKNGCGTCNACSR